MTTTDEMALASASTLEPARTTALGQVPNGALVGARAADTLRDIDGHRYRDDGKCCEQQNSYTAADVAGDGLSGLAVEVGVALAVKRRR